MEKSLCAWDKAENEHLMALIFSPNQQSIDAVMENHCMGSGRHLEISV